MNRQKQVTLDTFCAPQTTVLMASLHRTPEEMMIRFLTFTHDVWCLLPGGGIQWQLSQGTGKIGWCKLFEDLKKNLPIIKKEKQQNKQTKTQVGSLL